MKKRALVAGVLLSIFSMGMSAQAAMTISNAGETTLSDTNTSFWTDLWADGTNPGLSINGDNEKILNFTFESGGTIDSGASSDPAMIKIDNSSNQGIGITHDAGTTYFRGLDLSIAGLDANLGDNRGYTAIDNRAGTMIFDNNTVDIGVYANDTAVNNQGTIKFNVDKLVISRVYTAPSNIDGVVNNTGSMTINSSDVLISSSHVTNGQSEISGYAIQNDGIFEFNPDDKVGNYVIYGDIIVGLNNSDNVKTIINLHSGNNSIAQISGDLNVDSDDFQLNLTGKNTAWFLDEDNYTEVPNVTLKEQASIVLNSRNLLSDADWERNFKVLYLDNLKNDGTGIIQLTTDLKNNVGDRVTLFLIMKDLHCHL